jgi:pilus assembly protein Flp/PilA
MSRKKQMLFSDKGQGLIEYLIIVALVAVGSIAIVRSLGETIYVRFANITQALQNREPNLQPHTLTTDQYKKRGLDDFFKGAGNEGSSDH